MNNFKQKKLNSIIHTLVFKLSLGALALLPISVNANTIINDANIGNYKKTGIKISDDLEIRTTDNTAPHIDIDQNSRAWAGIYSSSNKQTKIIGDSFNIRSQISRGYTDFDGIYLANQAHLVSDSELDINIGSGHGIYLSSGGDGTFKNNVIINSREKSMGIHSYSSSAITRTRGIFEKVVDIHTKGKGSMGIVSLRTNDPNAKGNELIFKDYVLIHADTDSGAGIIVTEHYDNQNPKNNKPFTGTGDSVQFNNGLELTVAGGNAIEMDQNKGKLEIKDGSNSISIITKDSEKNAVEAIAGEVDIKGKSLITGNIVASANKYTNGKGVINLDLADGSMLLSSLDNDNGAGEINLGLSGSHSQWKMTGSSNINSLELSDDAKVSFGYDYATPEAVTSLNGNNAMVLETDSLAGNNGVFKMRAAIGKNIDNDLLKITGLQQAKGNHKIAVIDAKTGSATVTGKEKIKLVETNGGDAKFSLSSSAVDIGGYEFNTLDEFDNSNPDGKDWILSASSNSDSNQDGETSDGSDSNNDNGSAGDSGSGTKPKPDSKPNLTNTAKNAANILNSNYLMSYVETQTLLQRMGQIRTDDTASGKVWGRIYTGKLNSFNDNRLSGFDMDYYGLQMGLDRKLNYDKVNLYYGLMGGLSRGEVDHNVGDGSTKSYSLGLYGTLQSQNGFYLDGLVKYMHMTNKFNTLTGGGYRVNGDGHTNGFSLGAEMGKRIRLTSAGEAEHGWYLEPQAQLTFSHQNGATINATNGLRTRLGSYNSLIGRASLILGYTIQNNKNPVDIYFKTGYLREFDGKTSYTFNRVAKEKYDFGGNWWDNGIGINVRLNGKHHIYGDMVYSAGNKFNQKQINAGYRYNF
ncbi:autotransporter outer membrane beta-barrel domain-containing protein [Snodgrassella alvi]|uniref:autotransporter outer membrane beta-barrel domain-containing protein n=1 Tax=Snodgrassella alvi TaxID=1196083 RepID=UPI000A01A671|nr:autotransporter outer membrane beta-barrel domain-containing protein [Snodgrassella alvi]ORF03075.1 hypothetical protein BGH96_06450 [Snodgrassella alvi]